jgi:hypothetical protein
VISARRGIDLRQAGIAGGDGVLPGLFGAAGVPGGLDQIEQRARGLVRVGVEGPRRGDGDGVEVCGLVVAGAQRGGRAGGVGELGREPQTARPRPAVDLGLQVPGVPGLHPHRREPGRVAAALGGERFVAVLGRRLQDMPAGLLGIGLRVR